MFKILAFSVVFVMATNVTVNAQSAKPWGDFTCVAMADLSKLEGATGDIRVNNFIVSEKAAWANQHMTQLSVSFTLTNRGQGDSHISGDFILLAIDAQPLSAMSANLAFDTIKAGASETVRGRTFLNKGTLARAAQLCFRVYGAG